MGNRMKTDGHEAPPWSLKGGAKRHSPSGHGYQNGRSRQHHQEDNREAHGEKQLRGKKTVHNNDAYKKNIWRYTFEKRKNGRQWLGKKQQLQKNMKSNVLQFSSRKPGWGPTLRPIQWNTTFDWWPTLWVFLEHVQSWMGDQESNKKVKCLGGCPIVQLSGSKKIDLSNKNAQFFAANTCRTQTSNFKF